MSEFKSAHSRMFKGKGTSEGPGSGGSNSPTQTTPAKKVQMSTFKPLEAKLEVKLPTTPNVRPPVEKVTILRTSSPTKRTAPPPPPPLPPSSFALGMGMGQSSGKGGPIITISSYNSSSNNRFMNNNHLNGKENKSGLLRINVQSK